MATTSASPSSVDIGTLITRTPGVNSGRPCIAGTGISVQNISIFHNQGMIPEEIAKQKYLSLAQVHAALAYYYANKTEIDASLAQDIVDYDVAEKEWRQLRAEGRA